MLKKKDIILILSILFISVSGMLATRAINYKNSGKTAVIFVDSQEIERIPISNVNSEKTISFKFGENIGYLDVIDGAVRMKKMEVKICPNKICSDTGWISKPYETIVCLPNRIAVNIENAEVVKEDRNLVDGVAF